MEKVNSCSFSGIVRKIEPDRKGCIIYVQQAVNGVMNTILPVYIIPPLMEDFKALHVQEGKMIHIINAEMYEKDDFCRLRVTDISQIQKNMILNQVSVSGKIVSAEDEGKGFLIRVEQEVGGKLPTTFDVFCIPPIADEMRKKYSVGDSVVVRDAITYAKNSVVRLRITNTNQIQRIHENLFLGDVAAEDKFI